ncbi:hypothetical protein Poli38472_013437 [Pythium oligandrum]|uniref:Uncharacterized protein n=1 Tax=Pythium oligandrum TaxID=41045 RepID=A0A8K1C7R5_PYTOL|nr:hypothetical protein Poli38472_013437 [Pythium oligandrum]|eukprot:TMW57963.1 hypothetical protein Poli38472_013437 [Pythium oligandrum]
MRNRSNERALQALGFFRMKTDNRLQSAFVLLHRLVQHLAAIWKVDSSFCDSLHRVVRDSVSFEDLMVFHRRLKSLVFRDKRVILSMFHTGAGFDEMDLTNVYETKVRDVEASVEASMEDDSKTDTITVQTNERQLVTRIQLGVCSGMVECKR